MRQLDKNKIQIKYITGINKTLFNYPTPLDVLYDSCVNSVDDRLFSRAKIENTYFANETNVELIDKKVERIIDTLLNEGYIEKIGKDSYKIVKTIWD
jgi:hypothetical protein